MENTSSDEGAEQGNVDPVQGGEWRVFDEVRPFTEDVEGYQPRGRIVGTPIDVETDLNWSLPKRDSILPRIIPSGWFNWKEDLRSQFSIEAYWKLLLFPSMWLTPGVQFIFGPTLNPEQGRISVAQLKFRIFF